jgi:hypothetical protein
MKRVTLRELHESTTDRGRPIAHTEPANHPTTDKPFKRRRFLPAYQELLDARALQGGTDSTQILQEDRDSR